MTRVAAPGSRLEVVRWGPTCANEHDIAFDDLMKSMRRSFIMHVLISCTHIKVDLCGSAVLVIVGFA